MIQQIEWSPVGGVAVVEFLGTEIVGPEKAEELRLQLNSVLDGGERRLLLDFSPIRNMSSTVFATLLNFGRRVDEAGGELRACSMDGAVRFGADILGLGRFIPIHEDRASALAAFRGD